MGNQHKCHRSLAVVLRQHLKSTVLSVPVELAVIKQWLSIGPSQWEPEHMRHLVGSRKYEESGGGDG